MVKAKSRKVGFTPLLPFDLGSLSSPQPFYRIEESILESARAVEHGLRGRFRGYNVKAVDDHRVRGFLGEFIFDLTLNQLGIPHVYLHPVIQDDRLKREGELVPYDFLVGEDKVDVKTCCSRDTPRQVYVRVSRERRSRANIFVFTWITPKLDLGFFLGWMPRRMLEDCERRRVGDGVCYVAYTSTLKHFYSLLERWGCDV